MTKDELMKVKAVLLNIKPKPDGERQGRVQLAISLIDKELAVRKAQRDNFKDMYELQNDSWM